MQLDETVMPLMTRSVTVLEFESELNVHCKILAV